MPLLTRMVGTAPSRSTSGPGAIEALAPTARGPAHISGGRHVAVAVGPGQGEEIADVLRPPSSPRHDIITVEGGSVRGDRQPALAEPACTRASTTRSWASAAAARSTSRSTPPLGLARCRWSRWQRTSRTTGSASPVASLESDGGRKLSYGVQMPIAVVIDLDYVRRSGGDIERPGDRRRRQQPVRDRRLAAGRATAWERGRGRRGGHIRAHHGRDGRPAPHRRHRRPGVPDVGLAEGLVLSGLAMATAGSSRPCSGGDREIVHAIDHLFPDTAGHTASWPASGHSSPRPSVRTGTAPSPCSSHVFVTTTFPATRRMSG